MKFSTRHLVPALILPAALAYNTASAQVISACVSNADGTLRIATSCKRSETPLTWNQVGPQGAQGIAGPVGAQGPAGPQGVPGPVGPSGPVGATGATGAPGAVGAVGPAGPVGPTGPTGPAGAKAVVGYHRSPEVLNQTQLIRNGEKVLCQVTFSPKGGLVEIAAQVSYSLPGYQIGSMFVNTMIQMDGGQPVDPYNSAREVSIDQAGTLFHKILAYKVLPENGPTTFYVIGSDYGSSNVVNTDQWSPCKISVIEYGM